MLLFTDLDRTLLAHDYSIHPRVKESFRHAKSAGLQIVFVTARAPLSLKPIAVELDNIGMCVCYNGGWVGNLDSGTSLIESTLAEDLALSIMDDATMLGIEPIWYDAAGPHAAAITPTVVQQLANVGEVALPFMHQKAGPGPYKILCIDWRPENQLNTFANRWHAAANVAKSHKALLEIGPGNVSKGTAVVQLANHLGVSLSDCYAAGDAHNDISMLESVGNPMTVGNAVPEVKNIAKYVAPSCDDGGLADIIDRIIKHS